MIDNKLNEKGVESSYAVVFMRANCTNDSIKSLARFTSLSFFNKVSRVFSRYFCNILAAMKTEFCKNTNDAMNWHKLIYNNTVKEQRCSHRF